MTTHATTDEGRPPRGQAIRALRAALDLTQDQLAELCGWPGRLHISNIERGENECSKISTVQALAKGFGLSLDEAVALLELRLTTEDAVKAIQARKAAAP